MAKQPQTYASYLRTSLPERLTRKEAKMLQEDRDWCTANPGLAKQLDAMEGQYVYLQRDYPTLAETTYKAGTKLLVVERWLDRLHVLIEKDLVIQVRTDWVALTAPQRQTA